MNPDDLLALIRVPRPGTSLTHEQIMASALAVGPLSIATEPILGSQGREDAKDMVRFMSDSAHDLQRLAHGLAEQKEQYADQIINDLCDGVAAMTKRLNGYAAREAQRQRQARTDARKAIEDSLPDPDAPGGIYPEPSFQPSLRDLDGPEDEGAYRHYPDGRKTQMPGTPAELPEDAPRDDQGHLPPLVGTMPVWAPRELKHPQPDPQTQAAIGGP
jgi:hypothetical protein